MGGVQGGNGDDKVITNKEDKHKVTIKNIILLNLIINKMNQQEGVHKLDQTNTLIEYFATCGLSRAQLRDYIQLREGQVELEEDHKYPKEDFTNPDFFELMVTSRYPNWDKEILAFPDDMFKVQ